MSIFNSGFPNVAYFLPTGEGEKIAIKCRILTESPQVYAQPTAGLIDVGSQGMTISTWKKITINSKSKMIVNDVLYSIQSIVPVVADPYSQGFTKTKNRTEYYIQLV